MGPAFRHILCGVDGSGPACRAAEQAAWLATALEAQLTFLTVAQEAAPDAAIDAYRRTEGLGEEPLPLLASEAESCLATAQKTALAAGHSGAQRLIRTGKVAATLLSVALETGADTVILGRHQRNDLRRALTGSVSQKIAANSRLTLIQVW